MMDGMAISIRLFSKATQHILAHPLDFVLRTLRGFNKNQGMLMAGAIAYYALLSLVPLMILSIIVLSHLVEQRALLDALGHYLEWLVPSQSRAVLGDIANFLGDRTAIGVVLGVTLLFFSSLLFGILEKAMGIIFPHRGVVKKRHTLVSMVLPYGFVALLSVALLAVTLVTTALQAMAQDSVHLLGRDWSLVGVSGLFFYVFGVCAETVFVAVLYLTLPVGRMPLRHALLGGFSASVAWEIIRHVLVWYFTHLSTASVVYGSLTTAVVALFCMEIMAALLLLGAQVISEYERVEQELAQTPIA
jgi:YihY family inner membrane protein